MTRRIATGLVVLLLGVLALIWAALAWINVGLYADATGTSGYIPVATWAGGVAGVVAIVTAIIVMNGRSRRI